MSEELLSEFLAMTRRATCRVASVLDQLKPADRAKLTAALGADRGRIPDAVIARWIKEHVPDQGAMTPGNEAVGRHRKGACSC